MVCKKYIKRYFLMSLVISSITNAKRVKAEIWYSNIPIRKSSSPFVWILVTPLLYTLLMSSTSYLARLSEDYHVIPPLIFYHISWKPHIDTCTLYTNTALSLCLQKWLGIHVHYPYQTTRRASVGASNLTSYRVFLASHWTYLEKPRFKTTKYSSKRNYQQKLVQVQWNRQLWFIW